MLKIIKLSLFFTFLVLVSVNAVAAGELNATGNFTELNTIIDNSNNDINITKDYEYSVNDTNLNISESVNIWGNGHKVDFQNSSMCISGNNSNIIFDNITFKNFYQLNVSKNIIYLNVTFINCTFDTKEIIPLELIENGKSFEFEKTGPVSSYIKMLAKNIVGKSTGIAACKKIAQWVGKNIKHETNEGFYQTPYETVIRKKGNCCSQTDLFLQMCDAVGALKGHKVYYIHVGYAIFHTRHFFCMIDNLVIDVDARPYSPWGHASFGRRVYCITEYPYLLLPKNY